MIAEAKQQVREASQRYQARQRGEDIPKRRCRKDILSVTDTDAAYLAGIIDGEGCIQLIYRTRKGGQSKRFVVRIIVVNTHEAVLRWCKAVTGLGCVNTHTKRNHRRETFQWVLDAFGAEQILRLIQPYAKIKSLQILWALESRQFIVEKPKKGERLQREDFDRLCQLRENISNANGGQPMKLRSLYPVDFIEVP